MTVERARRAPWHAPERRAEMIARLPERDRAVTVIAHADTEEMRAFFRLKPISSRYASNMIRADYGEGTVWMVHFETRGVGRRDGKKFAKIADDLSGYRAYNDWQWPGVNLGELPDRVEKVALMVLTPKMGLEDAMRRCRHVLDSRSIGEAELVTAKIREYIQKFSDRRITKRRLQKLYGDFEKFMGEQVLTENFRGEDRRRIFELLEKAVRGRDRTERINVMVARQRLDAAFLRTIGRSFIEGKIKAKYNTALAVLNVERDITRSSLRGAALALAGIVGGYKRLKGHPAFANPGWVLEASDRTLAGQRRAIIDMITGLSQDTTIVRFEPYRSLAIECRDRLTEAQYSVVRMIERNQFARAREEVQGVVGHIAETLRSYENAHIERPTAKAS